MPDLWHSSPGLNMSPRTGSDIVARFLREGERYTMPSPGEGPERTRKALTGSLAAAKLLGLTEGLAATKVRTVKSYYAVPPLCVHAGFGPLLPNALHRLYRGTDTGRIGCKAGVRIADAKDEKHCRFSI